jgi:hypothetical protein
VRYNKIRHGCQASTLGWWFAVNLRKLVGFVVVIFVLFWIISQPSSAGGTVNGVLGDLRTAGESIVTFIRQVL